MMVITLSIDACLYVRIAYRLSAKPTVLAAACLASLPIVVVVGLSFCLQGAVDYTLSGDLPNLPARVGEEILVHTYMGLVSGIFLPFLALRLVQQFKAARSNRETESPSPTAISVSH
jgi:phosphotransferase system  glucose/maltose/N-acetylglucosamine-specific IIC component